MTDEPADVPPPLDDAPAAVVDPTPADAGAAAESTSETEPAAETEPPAEVDAAVDLDAIERDLAAVEAALDRLSDGTYWTDEVTGEPLPDELIAADPTARRAAAS